MKRKLDRETLEVAAFVLLPAVATIVGSCLKPIHLWDHLTAGAVLVWLTGAAMLQGVCLPMLSPSYSSKVSTIAGTVPPVLGGLLLSALSYSHVDAGTLCLAYGAIIALTGPWAMLVLWGGLTMLVSRYQARRVDSIRAHYPGRIVEVRHLPRGFLVIDARTKRVLGRTDRRGRLLV